MTTSNSECRWNEGIKICPDCKQNYVRLHNFCPKTARKRQTPTQRKLAINRIIDELGIPKNKQEIEIMAKKIHEVKQH